MNKYESMTKEELMSIIEKLEQRIAAKDNEESYQIIPVMAEETVPFAIHEGQDVKALEFAEQQIMEEIAFVIKGSDRLMLWRVIDDMTGEKRVMGMLRLAIKMQVGRIQVGK